MKLHRLLRTTNFRLSALYLILILLSFAAVGIAVYFLTGRMLQSQLKDTIKTGIAQLQNNYNKQGLPELITEIGEKENITGWNAPDFALIDPSGKQIAGSLAPHKYIDGWQTYAGKSEYDDPDEPEVMYADSVMLPGGYRLVAGEDGEYIDDFGATIIEAFTWGALLVIVLGIPCGFYLSRSFLRKVESLTRSTLAIIDGDLSHRLAVSRTNDELDGLARIINSMLDQIGALIENVQQVSNDIAHDLRTPISRLRQHLEDAQNAELSVSEYRAYITSSINEIDTILATFSALLKIAQIEAGSRRSGFKMVSLSDVVTGVADAFSPVIDENGQTLTTHIDPGIMISGDRELLTQLTFNLVENAVQHTAEGSAIEILLEAKSGRYRLSICDDSFGIPDPLREKVFQRFYRVEKSRNQPGNGLGLSIVRAIAELHGTSVILSDNAPGLRASVDFS